MWDVLRNGDSKAAAIMGFAQVYWKLDNYLCVLMVSKKFSQ